MKMHSDLGKMYRRNYMVKSQLRSLAEKSSALNAKITGDTQIDEWAESYITRADAQIDDVSDYMNYRNLGGLSKRMGHVIMKPAATPALPAPKLPIYGQQRVPAPPKEEEIAEEDLSQLGISTDSWPDVSLGNTVGVVGFLAITSGVLGIVTYNEYKNKTVSSLVGPRLKRAAVFSAIGGGAGLLFQGLMAGGQKTGWY